VLQVASSSIRTRVYPNFAFISQTVRIEATMQSPAHSSSNLSTYFAPTSPAFYTPMAGSTVFFITSQVSIPFTVPDQQDRAASYDSLDRTSSSALTPPLSDIGKHEAEFNYSTNTTQERRPPRLRRYRVACTECRKVRRKCTRDSNTTACVRCRTRQRTCVFEPAHRRLSRNQIPYLFQGTTLEPSTFHIGQGVALDA
jgi:hypothetical protein